MHEARFWRRSRFDDGGRHGASLRGALAQVGGAFERYLVATLLLGAFALTSAHAQGGVIQVIAEEGAMVFIDGVFVGTTSASQGGLVVLDVTPGTRAVRVVLGGDVLSDASVEVSAGGVATLSAAAPPGPRGDTGASTTGSQQVHGWSQQFGTQQSDWAYEVATGPNGRLAVAGATAGALSGPNQGGNDVFVRVLDAAVTVVWEEQFGSAEDDVAVALAMDASGRVAVVGWTNGALTGENAGGTDAFVRVFDADGGLLWEEQFGGEGHDIAFGVAFTADGHLAVVGRTASPLFGPMVGSIDAFVRVHRADDGAVVWGEQFGSPGGDSARSVAGFDDGRLVVAGYVAGRFVLPRYGARDAFVRVYAPDGAVVWQDQFGSVQDDIVWGVATDGVDRIMVVGSTDGSLFTASVGDREPFVRTYDARGQVLYQTQFRASEEASAAIFRTVVYDGVGNAVLGGGVWGQVSDAYRIVNSRLYRVVLDADHALVWQDVVRATGTNLVNGVAVDAAGRLVFGGWVVGDVFGASAGGTDAFVQVLPAPEGVELVSPW